MLEGNVILFLSFLCFLKINRIFTAEIILFLPIKRNKIGMKTLKSTQTLRVVLGLFLAFAMSGKMWAQSSNSRFLAEGAVHEYLE